MKYDPNKIEPLRNPIENYSSMEQSQKLIELGVPIDSCDCHYAKGKNNPEETFLPYLYFNTRSFTYEQERMPHLILYPCWSIGRLEEIIKISTLKGIVPNLTYPTYSEAYNSEKETYIDTLIGVIEYYKELGIMKFDRLGLDENEK